MLVLLYYLPGVIVLSSPIVIVCYIIFRKSQWIRKRRNGMMFLLLSTLAISPILILNQFEINAYYYGSPGGAATFSLSPGERNTLGPLSNQGSLHGSDFEVRIFVENGNVTFYVVDENRPDVFYYSGTYANDTNLAVSLPYPLSGPFTVANWTANYYNPSQDQTIEVDTQIIMWVIMIFPSPLDQRLRVLLIPHQILAALWICAGVASCYQWRFKAKKEKSKI